MEIDPKIRFDLSEPNLPEEERIFIPPDLIDYFLINKNIQSAYVLLRLNGYSHESARTRLNLFGISTKKLDAVGIRENPYEVPPEQKEEDSVENIASKGWRTKKKLDLPKLRALIDAKKSYAFIRSEFFGYSEAQLKAAIKKVISPDWKQPAYEDEKEDDKYD
jgi:hypothetical protein